MNCDFKANNKNNYVIIKTSNHVGKMNKNNQ